MAKVTTSTYLRNVGKSLGYAVGDVFEKYNPVVTSIAKSSKDAYYDMKVSMQAMKNNNISQATKNFMDNTKSSWSNLIDDLKSGKWYDKEQNDDDDPFGLSDVDDWGDEIDNMTSSEVEVSSTKQIMQSLDSTSAAISKSVGYASAQSADYIVKSNNAASRALYDLNKQGFTQISNQLNNINNSIDGLVKLGDSLSVHMQNSAIFYTNTTETLNKLNANVEKLAKASEAGTRLASGRKIKSNNKGTDRFMYGDQVDMAEYMNMVKENIEEQRQMIGAIFGLVSPKSHGGGGGSGGYSGGHRGGRSGKGSSRMQEILTGAIDLMIPKIAKKSMEEFNTALSNAIITSLGQAGVKAAKSNNPLTAILASIFLPKDNFKTQVNPGNYEKGQVAWDGIARKSLVEVIPTYLAKILASLGGEERYFDYESGRFMTMGAINRKKEFMEHQAAIRAGGKFRETALKNSTGQIAEEIDTFFDRAFMIGMDFQNIRRHIKDKTWLKTFGLSEKSARVLKEIMDGADKGVYDRNMYSNFGAGVYKERQAHGKSVMLEELSGHSIQNYANNGFTGLQDAHNKTQADYLRSIYQMVGNIYGTMQMGGGGFAGEPGKAGQKVSGKVKNIFDPDKDVWSSTASNVVKKPDTYDPLDFMTPEERKKYEKRKKAGKAMGYGTEYMDKWKDEDFNFDDFFDEKTPGPIAKVLKSAQKVKSIYDVPFVMFSNMLGKMTSGINTLFWGDENNDGLINKLDNKLNDLWGRIKDIITGNTKFKDLKQSIKDEFTGFVDRHFGDDFKGRVNNSLIRGGFKGANIEVKKDKRGNTRYYQVDPKTGKKKQVKAEYAQELLGYEAEGLNTTVGSMRAIAHDAKALKESGSGSGLPRIYGGASEVTGTNFLMDSIMTLINGVSHFASATVSGDASVEKERKQIYGSLQEAMQDMNEAKGAMAIGGLAGGGISLLTSAVVGPLAGAAVGAGIGLVSKSKKIQEYLFGAKPGETEEEYNNSLRKDLKTFFADNGMDNVVIGGAVGGVASTLITGSPVIGAIAGSAIGFASKSEKIQEYLFGKELANGRYKEGVIPKDLQDHIKKAAPNIGAGAIAGILAGPFGPVANLMVGAGVGYLSTSKSFQEWMFGDGTKENRGLVGKIHDKVINPLDNIMHNISNSTTGFLRRMGRSINMGLKGIGERIKQMYIGKINDGSMLGKALKFGQNVVTAPISIAGGILQGASNMSQKHNLKKGYDVYDTEKGRNLTAAERLEMRASFKKSDIKLKDGSKLKYDKKTDRYITPGGEVLTPDQVQQQIDSGQLDVTDKFLKSIGYKKFSNFDKALTGLQSVEDVDALKSQLAGLQNRKNDRLSGNSDILRDLRGQLDEMNLDEKTKRAVYNAYRTGKGIDKALGDIGNDEYKEILNAYGDRFNEEDKKYIAKNAKLAELVKNGVDLRSNGDITSMLNLLDTEKKLNWTGDKLEEKKAEDKDTNIVGLIAHLDELVAYYMDKTPYVVKGEWKKGIQKVLKGGTKENTAAEEGLKAQKAEGYKKDKNGRWRRPNGQFASADEIEGLSLNSIFGGEEEAPMESAEGSRISRLLSGGLAEDKRTEFTSDGIIQYIRNGDEWNIDRTDRETKSTLEKRATFQKAIASIPVIGTGISSMVSGFSSLKEKLFGDGEEKKGILGSIMDFLSGDLEGPLSWLSTIIGGTPVGMFGKSLKNFMSGVTLQSVLTNVAGPILAGFLISGGADDIAHDITNGAYGVGKGNKNRTVYTGANGEKLYYDKEKKIFVTENGTQYMGEVSAAAGDTASLSDRMKLGLGRDVLTAGAGIGHTQSLFTKLIGGNSIVKKATSKAGSGLKMLTKIGTNAATDAELAELSLKIVNAMNHLADDILPRIPFVKKAGKEAIEAFTQRLGMSLGRAAESAGKTAASASKVIPVIGWVAAIGFAVADFTTGFQDVAVTFGIDKDAATTGQRIASGLIRMLKNLIPLIGVLIPDSMIIDIFCDTLAPALGIDVEELKNARAAAQAKLDEYNEGLAEEDQLTWEQYQKQVEHNYTWTEKLGNAAKTKISNIKQGITNIKQNGLKNTLMNTPAMQAVQKFGNGIKEKVVDPIANGISYLTGTFDQSERDAEAAIAGKKSLAEYMDISNLQTQDGNPLGTFGKVAAYTGKIVAVPAVITSKIGRDISAKFTAIAGKIKTAVNSLNQMDAEYLEIVKTGSLSKLWTKETTHDEENPLDGIMGALNFGEKVMYTLPTIGAWAGNSIYSFFTSTFGKMGEESKNLDSAVETLKALAKEGAIGAIWETKYEPKNAGPIGTLFSAGFTINKVFQTISALLQKLIGPIKEVVDGVKETVGGVVDDAKDFVGDKVNSAKNAVGGVASSVGNAVGTAASNAWNKFTNWVTGGSSFVSQFDPRYANKQISGTSFAQKGCGPAVASMAASAYGRDLSVGDALSASRGYQNPNGVSMDYFIRALGSKGIRTRLMTGGSSADIYSSLASGHPAILLGRDPYNTSKDFSPFGPGNHYVFANGLDRNGNVIISDPELSGPRAYSPAILNSTKFALDTSGGASDTAEAQQIYAYLTGKGISPAGAAGILGNMEKESGVNPRRLQGDFSSGYAKSLEYTNAVDNGVTDRSSFANDSKGYGLVQFTYNKYKEQLYDRAKANNKSVGDLGVQLDTLWDMISGASYFDSIKNATDPAAAASVFLREYERPKDIPGTEPHRQKEAADYYNMYSGKHYTYTGTTSTLPGSTGAMTTGDTEDNGVFKVLNLVKNAFSTAFGGVMSNSGSSMGGSSPVLGNATSVSFSGSTPVELMKSILGKISYSMSGPRNPEAGSADCSSTVQWAVKKATGIDIGGNTGVQYNNSNLTPVWYDQGRYMQSLPNNLQPNDIIFFARDGRSDKGNSLDHVGHVGIYEGNGRYIDHGSGMGPKEKDIKFGDAGRIIKVSRITGGANSGAGSGLYIRDYGELANVSAGSSGLLLGARPGSRTYNLANSINSTMKSARLYYGGASDVQTGATNILTGMRSSVSRASGTVSSDLVNKLLESISNLLGTIANNTAPVERIYEVLAAYVSGGSNAQKMRTETESTNMEDDEVTNNIEQLAGVLAQLAKG